MQQKSNKPPLRPAEEHPQQKKPDDKKFTRVKNAHASGDGALEKKDEELPPEEPKNSEPPY